MPRVPRTRSPGRPGRLGLLGAVLCAAALVALAVPGVGWLAATTAHGHGLDDEPRALRLPAHETYGIYVTDADNSGYSVGCTGTDTRTGRPVRFADPGWSIGTETEMLEQTFDTGSGALTIICTGDEHVETRPVPDGGALVLGIALAGMLGCTGAGLLVAAIATRGQRQATTLPRSTTRAGSASTDRSSRGLRG
ncbi:hypothetical protein [Pimelobacter simplex]|uniref:hypothetical protein n=1 Tax=Nocardioides simplex TaxID=2045 RepID=UPI003AABC3EA